MNADFRLPNSESGTTESDLKDRTKKFSLRIIRLVESLPRSSVARILGNQLLAAGTSVGANYRASCKSRSTAEFIAKIGVVEEEADECCFWLELIMEAGLMPPSRLKALHKEADELTAIMAASRITAAKRRTR